MTEAPFLARDMTIEARKFLYACAFWAVAADEQLKPSEQEWLIKQFGTEGATKSLDEFVDLESEAFFEVFDGAANELTTEDKRTIFPGLEKWLISCIESDSSVTPQDVEIIGKIKERLSLDSELSRLFNDQPDPRHSGSPRLVCGRNTCRTERILAGHTGEVTSLDISRDGKYVVSGSEDCTVRLWDFITGTQIKMLKGHEAGIGDVCFCNNGRGVLSGDRLGAIRSWNVDTAKTTWENDGRKRGGITGLASFADGKRFAYASDIGVAGLIEAGQGKEIRVFGEKKRGALHDVAVSRDGKFVLTCGDDKTVRLWDAGDGRERTVFQGHDDGVISACFSDDGKMVLSGSRDNTVRLWNTASGEEIRTFKGHTFSVYSVCFSPDGLQVMSASWDHTVRIWDAKTGNMVFKIESLDSRFSNLVCNPDGRSVIMASSDKNVHIVDISNGR